MKAQAEYREIEYERPFLYPKQERAFFNTSRYSYCEASTKAGKTHCAIVWICEIAVLEGEQGKNYWWIAPVRAQAKIAFSRICNALPKNMYRKNEAELYIEFLNGARVWFKSGEKPDNLYGEDVYGAILDEASRCRFDSWIAIRSTLTATRGWIRLIGNVIGKNNWFYIECRAVERGRKNAEYHKITAYDAVEAGVLDIQEVEDAKSVLSKPVFDALYLAIASDDDMAFIKSDNVQNAMKRTDVQGYGAKIIGADPSQGKNDEASFVLRQGALVPWVEEHKGMDEIGFKGHLLRLIQSEKPDKVFVDGTGFGITIVKQMWDEFPNLKSLIVPVNFASRSLYPEEYYNKRAEIWGEMGKWLDDQKEPPQIPDNDKLAVEITCVNRKDHTSGRLLLESKDDLKARGYESTNMADGLALTFAEPVQIYNQKKINYSTRQRKRIIT